MHITLLKALLLAAMGLVAIVFGLLPIKVSFLQLIPAHFLVLL